MSRFIHGKWRVTGTFAAKVVKGRFSFAFKPSYRRSYRFVATAMTGNVTSSKSAAKTVKVR